MSAPSTSAQSVETKCPVALADVDLFAPGAQEHWYDAYQILHEQGPIQRLPGGGYLPGTDAFVVTKYDDIVRVVKDPVLFSPSYTRAASSEIEERMFREAGFEGSAETRDSLRPTLAMHNDATDELVHEAGV